MDKQNEDEPMPQFNTDSKLPDEPAEQMSQEEGMPQEQMPQEGMPEEGMPEEVKEMPEEVKEMPEEVKEMPEEAMPEEGMSEEGMPEEEKEMSEEEPTKEMTDAPEESRQTEKVDIILKEAGNFRKKLNTLKKRLPTMDDTEKDTIRNGVIKEFIRVLKISKPASTRKKYGRRLNGLRNSFHDSLNLLNGTSKKRPKRKSRKEKMESPQSMEPETFSESQP